MAFFQTPPALGDQFGSDRLLRSYLERTLSPGIRAEIEPGLAALGELAGGELYRQLEAQRDDQPELVSWDAWGKRVDRIELTPLWKRAAPMAAEEGLVAIPYEKRHGEWSRVHQMAKVYLFAESTAMYTCPLAMTDGAAKTLSVSKNRELLERALPRLLSRDPSRMWTSGQWMTERTGGSDVALTETVAKAAPGGHRLHGTKWFTSATTSEMALTLARPEGNPPGGHGLALFYVETRAEDGSLAEGIFVNRLKDKLGTRMVPTAELTLDGAFARLVAEPTGGIKAITPMLGITRTWNAVCAVANMRRAVALARDYAGRRVAFGAKLERKPLHADTLDGMEAELTGAFLLSFRVVELLGREECGVATDEEKQLLRLLTPLAKLTTGKQAVAVASEALESFGGAGYVEDTGLPRILRDAQVFPIWEGTTNVLALDVLRVLSHGTTLDVLAREAERATRDVSPDLVACAAASRRAIAHARAWSEQALARGSDALEAGARRFALTLGRAIELALVAEHGAFCAARGDVSISNAAHRLAQHGVDLVVDA